MSDINDAFGVTEEETVETAAPVEDAVEEPVAEEAAPSWYEKAGFENEDDALKKIENLKKWESDLNRKSSELGAQKTQPQDTPAPAVPASDDDPYAGLDPSSAATLRKIVQAEAARIAAAEVAKVAPGAELGVAQFNRAAQKEFESFAETASIDPAELSAVMDSHNLWPDKPDLEALNEQMKVGAAFIKQQKFDPAAEREKLREEILKELQDEGATVKAVEPAKAKLPDTSDDDLPENVGLFGAMNWLRKQQS